MNDLNIKEDEKHVISIIFWFNSNIEGVNIFLNLLKEIIISVIYIFFLLRNKKCKSLDIISTFWDLKLLELKEISIFLCLSEEKWDKLI